MEATRKGFSRVGVKGTWSWAFISVGVGCVGLGLAFYLLGKMNSPWSLEVDMASSRSSDAQLFYSTDGRGFRESRSVFEPVHGERTLAAFDQPTGQTLRFGLPGRSLHRLRFDPLRGPGTFTIEAIRLVDRRGRVVKDFPPARWLPDHQIATSRRDGNRIHYVTEAGANDPIILLKIDRVIRPPLSARLIDGFWIFWLAGAVLMVAGGWRWRQPVWLRVEQACGRYELVLAVLLIGIGALARSFDRFTRPHLWAEDGVVYFIEAMELGWWSLWMPFAGLGYLNTVQRLESLAVVNMVPLEWVPLGFTFAALLNAALLCWALRRTFIDHPAWVRVFLYGAVFFVFNLDNMFNNLANSQWYLGAALLLSICWKPHPRRVGRFGDCLLITILGLSGPYAIPLVPVFLARIFMEGNLRRFWPYAASWMIPAIIQTGVYWFSPRVVREPSLGVFVNGGLEFLQSIAPLFWLSLLVWGWLGFLLWQAWRVGLSWQKEIRPTLLLGLGTGAIIGAALLSMGTEVMGLSVFGERTRYSYIPSLSVYCILFLLSGRERIRIITAGLLLAISLLGFRSHQHNDAKWDVYVRYAEFLPDDETLIVPTKPVWWFYPGWHVRLSGGGKKEMARINLLEPLHWNLGEVVGLSAKQLETGKVSVSVGEDYSFVEWVFHNESGESWSDGVLEVEIESEDGRMMQLELWFMDGDHWRRQWLALYAPPHLVRPFAFRGTDASKVALRIYPRTRDPLVFRRLDLCFHRPAAEGVGGWTLMDRMDQSSPDETNDSRAAR